MGNATARTTSSVMSVTTPEAFFGQEIQSIPSGASARNNAGSLAASALRFFVKKWT
jgi:hypothetical protein